MPMNDDKNPVGEHSSTSHSQSSTSTNSNAGSAIFSKKYYNDTVPEETVRSTLPVELAEEYLSFVQQCAKRRQVLRLQDDVPCQPKEIPEKQVAHTTPSDDNKPAKENLPVPKTCEKSENAKAKKSKGRRRKNTSKNLLLCLLCSVELPTKQEKQEHYSEHLGPRGYECTFCAKAFEKMPALVSHVSRIHRIDKKLACKICGKKFRREWLLRSHLMTHTSGRKFSCPTCKRGFTHKRPLFEHISGHVGFNPYKCEECGKRFQKSSYLSHHRKYHVAVCPFKCPQCTVRCASYAALEVHSFLHSEKRGFECKDCDVVIPYKLKTSHLMSHNRKKGWVCDLCPATFHAKSVFNDHLKAHACIKEYKCDECDQVFKTVDECSGHACPKWRNSRSVASCPFCKAFFRKVSLERHQKSCRKRGTGVKSNSDDEEELWDENGDCGNGDRCECSSDESEVDESEADEENLALGAACQSEALDLDRGLLQKMQQDELECEEDTDEEELL